MVKHTQIIRRLLQFLNDAKHSKNFKNTDDPVREQLTYVWCRITLEVKQYQFYIDPIVSNIMVIFFFSILAGNRKFYPKGTRNSTSSEKYFSDVLN